MNEDPGSSFHNTTDFHSNQHGSAEASSDLGGLSNLFDQFYDSLDNFEDNENAIQHGGAETASNLDSYPVQGLQSNSHFLPNGNNPSNGFNYNYFSYNQPHIHTPQFPASRVPNQVQHSVDALGRQNRFHQPNGAENAPDSTRSQTNLESCPKALSNVPLVQPSQHSAYSRSNSQAGSAALTSLSKYSNISQISCGNTPNLPLQPITNLNSRQSVPTPSPNPADRPLYTVPPQDYLHTVNPNSLIHRPPPDPNLLQYNPPPVVASRPSQFTSATPGNPSTDIPTFSSQDQSLSASMGRPSSRNASAATNTKKVQFSNQLDEQSCRSTSGRRKSSSGPKKRKMAHKKRKKNRFPSPLNRDEDLDGASSDSEKDSDNSDDSDRDSNGDKSDDRNSEEENDEQQKGGEGDSARENGQPTHPTLYVGAGDDLKIRERHRRGNPFLRSTPGGSTLFKQRTSVANRKYFGMLDKQGKLTREQVAAIVKNYEGKTFSALDHSETIIWDTLASMIGEGHANFIFIEASKRPTLARDLLSESQSHIYNAFKFPSFSLVFPPTDIGGTVNYAVTDYGKDAPPNFLVWMKANCPDVLEAFTKQCGLYTQAIWNPTQEAQEGVEKARKIAKKKEKKNNPDAWLANYVDETRDGIRIWNDTILEITVEMARRVFHGSMLDRFKRNGWPLGQGEIMYWNVIGGPHREEIINSHLLPKVETDDGPREAGLASYSNLKKPDMAVWMKFLLDHQNGTIGWEDGMLFKDVRNDSPHIAKSRRLWFKKLVSSTRSESGLGSQPTFDEETATRKEILNLLEEDAQEDDLEPQTPREGSPVMASPPDRPNPKSKVTRSIDNPSNPVGPTNPMNPTPPTAPPKKSKGGKNASKPNGPISNDGSSAAKPTDRSNPTNTTDPTNPTDPTDPANPLPDPTGPTAPQKKARGRPKAAQAPPDKEKQQQKEVAAATTSSTSKGQKQGKKSGKENETPSQEQQSLDVGGRKLRNRPDTTTTTTTTKGLKRKGTQLESEKTKVPRPNAKNGRKTK